MTAPTMPTAWVSWAGPQPSQYGTNIPFSSSPWSGLTLTYWQRSVDNHHTDTQNKTHNNRGKHKIRLMCMLGGFATNILQSSSILLHVYFIFYSFLFLTVFCNYSLFKSVCVVFYSSVGSDCTIPVSPQDQYGDSCGEGIIGKTISWLGEFTRTLPQDWTTRKIREDMSTRLLCHHITWWTKVNNWL